MTDVVKTEVSTVASNTPSDDKSTDKSTSNENKKEETSMYNYIFIGVLVVVLVVLLYYAYCRFVDNSTSEPLVKGNQQERDDPVIDFNLRESINELQRIQRNILKTLSDNADI